ncbi:transglutaminase-like cysteine peptidase [Legionella feeleii]|uniref:Periplasmic protein n=2 Tax=Legionella TaxID=445 RepID=A0A0W0U659_9GAMM|nr:transglutaminase-like cysteine peptidase [Legionella feeleii]KTD03063.1 periplasmic protein [Legionella feeleii]SPX60835.1 periplasmic protein [Legionella feeleii]
MYKEYWLPTGKNQNVANTLAGLLFLLFFLAPQNSFSKYSHSVASHKEIVMRQQDSKDPAKRRFTAWKQLIINYRSQSLNNKLKAVNDFFNQFTFEQDESYQGTTDYWKTPDEFIADGGGDCEDFSIAKYFTLLALGVPIQTLRITYVKSVEFNRAHMVLAYYAKPDLEPLILDNLTGKILPASKRPDLIPVYSFNGEGLWLAKQRGNDKPLGDSARLSKWRDLIERMQKKGD